MKLNSGSLIVRFFRDQSAQMLPIMAFMVVVFMSIAAFSVSIGSTYVQQHELQNAANASALAGAQAAAQQHCGNQRRECLQLAVRR